MRTILLLLAIALPVGAQNLPKDFSENFSTAKTATVEPYSSASGQDVFGSQASVSCKNGGCVGVSEPLSIPATAYAAIFKSGDWRIAAYCVTEFGGCSNPKNKTAAWIVSTNDGIRVLFVSPKKPIDSAKAEKKLKSFWNFKNFWRIEYVYNATTKSFWPPNGESLRQALEN